MTTIAFSVGCMLAGLVVPVMIALSLTGQKPKPATGAIVPRRPDPGPTTRVEVRVVFVGLVSPSDETYRVVEIIGGEQCTSNLLPAPRQ